MTITMGNQQVNEDKWLFEVQKNVDFTETSAVIYTKTTDRVTWLRRVRDSVTPLAREEFSDLMSGRSKFIEYSMITVPAMIQNYFFGLSQKKEKEGKERTASTYLKLARWFNELALSNCVSTAWVDIQGVGSIELLIEPTLHPDYDFCSMRAVRVHPFDIVNDDASELHTTLVTAAYHAMARRAAWPFNWFWDILERLGAIWNIRDGVMRLSDNPSFFGRLLETWDTSLMFRKMSYDADEFAIIFGPIARIEVLMNKEEYAKCVKYVRQEPEENGEDS